MTANSNRFAFIPLSRSRIYGGALHLEIMLLGLKFAACKAWQHFATTKSLPRIDKRLKVRTLGSAANHSHDVILEDVREKEEASCTES